MALFLTPFTYLFVSLFMSPVLAIFLTDSSNVFFPRGIGGILLQFFSGNCMLYRIFIFRFVISIFVRLV